MGTSLSLAFRGTVRDVTVLDTPTTPTLSSLGIGARLDSEIGFASHVFPAVTIGGSFWGLVSGCVPRESFHSPRQESAPSSPEAAAPDAQTRQPLTLGCGLDMKESSQLLRPFWVSVLTWRPCQGGGRLGAHAQ